MIHARVKKSTCSCRTVAPREIQVEDPSSRISRGTVYRSAVKNNIDEHFKTISEYAIVPLIGIKHWQVGQKLSPLL